ncbi:hypothetical protein ACFW6K_18505 [Streptomyces sp. NPDC058733]|uniref:hypothetical protein n=1 Tax=unclassified Streptomyces TaxID=2593676 RepID=UPI00367CFE04
MGDEAKLIDPSGIPHFIGDLGTLDTDVMLLTANAGQFRASGSNLHTTFQQLSAFYSAPEAEQLFGTTLPVQQKSDAFADGLEQVAGALSDYSLEVQPLVQKLDALKAEATAFVNSVSGDDDWRKDHDKVDRNNDLWHDVNHTVAAFEAAERKAYNKIMALIGGTPLVADDGSHGKNMYGFDAAVLDQAQETPWGAPAEKEYEGWAWLVHQGKQVWDGIWYDGVVATVHGLGTLVGWDGWDAAGEAWTNLAKLGTAAALTSATMGAWWLVPDKELPSWLRDSRTVYKQTVKGFLAWDQWKTNPARAAGGFGFNVLTVLGTEGAGAAASGTGKAGAAARVASAAGKVGRVIDPMTYVGKAGKFAFVKVGDTFTALRNLHTSAATDLLEEANTLRSPGIPDTAIPYLDKTTGKIVYLTDEGHILNADGTLRQHATEAAHESSAADRARLTARSPHSEPSVRRPEPVGARSEMSSAADTTQPGRRLDPGHATAGAADTVHRMPEDLPSRTGHGTPAGHSSGSGSSGGNGGHNDTHHSAEDTTGNETGSTVDPDSGIPSQRADAQRPPFMHEGPNPYGPRGSLSLEQIQEIQVYRANHEPGYYEHFYKKNLGWRKDVDLRDESGYAPPQLTKLSEDGPWVNAKETPAAPEPHYLDDDYVNVGADTVKDKSRLALLNAAAQKRYFAVQWDNLVRKWTAHAGEVHQVHGTTETGAEWAEARGTYKESHTAMGDATEQFGEAAARHHFIAENYGDFKEEALLGPGNGNDQFDQVWKHDDGRIVVVEAKSSPGTELGSRKLADGRRVSQGSREYFLDILKAMKRRGEFTLAKDLKKALDSNKLEYVVVKGQKNAGTYTGYLYRRFDISKGTLP